jgi:hypothetical protein
MGLIILLVVLILLFCGGRVYYGSPNVTMAGASALCC